jgi:diguanylate cyclase
MYAQMFDAVDLGLVAFAPDFSVLDWNSWMATRTGINKTDAMGKNLLDLFADLQSAWFERNCRSVLKFGNYAFFSQKIHGYCIPIERRNTVSREFRNMQQNCTLGPLRDESSAVTGLFLMVQDVTELAIYEKKLSDLANKDGLTGVYNRGHLERCLAGEFSRHKRYDSHLSVILFDIDHFKQVNDRFGHPAGDEVLRQLVGLIESNLRASDMLARYGGEEFIILLPESGIEAARGVAAKICSLAEATTFNHNTQRISITISAGISALTQSIESSEALIDAADRALYQAKATGRNRTVADGDYGSSGAVSCSASVRRQNADSFESPQ